jgi:hypothetical protein
MNVPLEVGVEGIGVWSPELPDWPTAQTLLRGHAPGVPNADARPCASVLPAAERRRAPQAVLIALEAAQQACAMAARAACELPHVFASAHGDLSINDYLCATLARAPLEVSPTRFHNSVHNAAAGYWAIATGCHQNSSAISAGAATFAAGLLEAAVLVRSESRAVLLCAYDVPAVGPLRDVVACRSAFAVALVLAPPTTRAGMQLRLHSRRVSTAGVAPPPSLLHPSHADNPAARSLPVLAALARQAHAGVELAAGPALALNVEIFS